MPPIAIAMFLLLSTDPTLKTVWDGVYTSDQAARGEAAYADSCSGCHRDDLRGYNGVLVGGRFMDSWREDTLNSRRLPPSEQPYFTPGFPLQLPLQHGVRIRSLDGAR